MDCKEAEEQLLQYLVGSLDSQEMSRIDNHLDTCVQCSSRLSQDSDLVASLAYAVPQLAAPSRMKRQLLSSIGGGAASDSSATEIPRWTRFLPDLSGWLAARSGLAVASLLIVVMVLGGGWFNSRLNNIDEEKEVLATQIESVAEGEAEMIEKLKSNAI